jgi:KTSC domain
MRLKMIEWIPVSNSTRIIAEAYDPETETIYVRFLDGVEWWYSACPPQVWAEFTAPNQSRGQYINDVLDFKPNGRYGG